MEDSPVPPVRKTVQQRPPKHIVWDRVTAISTFLVAMGTFLALIFAGFQIHELREEAKIQHLLDQLKQFDGPAFLAKRKALAASRMDTTRERLRPLDLDNVPTEMDDALNFCDDLGLLNRRGALDRHDVWSSFGYWLFAVYADARPHIDDLRKQSPATFNECSDLIESIRPIEVKEDGGSEDHPNADDIYGIYSGEIEAQPEVPTRRRSKPSK
jgi:hypothetical protein